MYKFLVSYCCSAFKERTIGTKVLDVDNFMRHLTEALASYKMPVSEQGLVSLPSKAHSTVSCGVARTMGLGEDDVVARRHRGTWGAYAKRHNAALIEGLACAVQTRAAYLADPDRVEGETVEDDVSHVIVAVLAFAGPKSPLPPWTLVHNIAGGNAEFVPTAETPPSEMLHRFIALAQESEKYWANWMIVAD